MEETIGTRINVNRTEEAVATGAEQIAVGCPFCRIMLSDGLTLQQSEGNARPEVEVLDVAQMLLASIKRAPEPAETADVVAEAEQATAAAAATDDKLSEELKNPQSSGPDDDQAIAAKSNISVDESGKVTAVEPATDSPESQDTEASAKPVEDTASKAADLSASEKEAAAMANVGPVNAGPSASSSATPTGAESPAFTPEPVAAAESDQTAKAAPVEADAAENGDAADAPKDDSPNEPARIVPVDEAAAPDPVAEDAAPLKNASPTASEVSSGANAASSDAQFAENEFEGSKFMIAEGGPFEPKPPLLDAPEDPDKT